MLNKITKQIMRVVWWIIQWSVRIALLIVLFMSILQINSNLVNIQEQIFELSADNTKLYTKVNQEYTLLKKEIQRPSYDYLKSITVYLVGQKDGMLWAGTGVIVKTTSDSTYILTNHHVAPEASLVLVLTENETYSTELVKSSKIHDLSLLKVHGTISKKRSVVGFSVSMPSDKIYLCGHALGIPFQYGEGVVAGYDDIGTLLIQIPTIWGNSGSGVINSDGELVGLVYAMQVETINGIFPVPRLTHGMSINGMEIIKFLDELI